MKLRVFVAAALFLAASAVMSASTITQTLTFSSAPGTSVTDSGFNYTLLFAPFAGAPGTLSSVTISLDDTVTLELDASSTGGTKTVKSLQGSGTINASVPDPTIAGNTLADVFATVTSSTYDYSPNVTVTSLTPFTQMAGTLNGTSGVITYTSPAILAYFTTTAHPEVDVVAGTFSGAGNYTAGTQISSTGLAYGSVTITYDYTPEPATIGMALGGVMCLLFGVRRSRRV